MFVARAIFWITPRHLWPGKKVVGRCDPLKPNNGYDKNFK
jgi:hypothetical protein